MNEDSLLAVWSAGTCLVLQQLFGKSTTPACLWPLEIRGVGHLTAGCSLLSRFVFLLLLLLLLVQQLKHVTIALLKRNSTDHSLRAPLQGV
jgi:hypothetical protein